MLLNQSAIGVVWLLVLVPFIAGCGSNDVKKAKEFMACLFGCGSVLRA